jgi:hypothetical protein
MPVVVYIRGGGRLRATKQTAMQIAELLVTTSTTNQQHKKDTETKKQHF